MLLLLLLMVLLPVMIAAWVDPITCVIMEDPVELPTSGHIVDRAVIARHLLTDERDPFNRAPLRIDQVVPGMTCTRFVGWACTTVCLCVEMSVCACLCAEQPLGVLRPS